MKVFTSQSPCAQTLPFVKFIFPPIAEVLAIEKTWPPNPYVLYSYLSQSWLCKCRYYHGFLLTLSYYTIILPLPYCIWKHFGTNGLLRVSCFPKLLSYLLVSSTQSLTCAWKRLWNPQMCLKIPNEISLCVSSPGKTDVGGDRRLKLHKLDHTLPNHSPTIIRSNNIVSVLNSLSWKSDASLPLIVLLV